MDVKYVAVSLQAPFYLLHAALGTPLNTFRAVWHDHSTLLGQIVDLAEIGLCGYIRDRVSPFAVLTNLRQVFGYDVHKSGECNLLYGKLV